MTGLYASRLPAPSAVELARKELRELEIDQRRALADARAYAAEHKPEIEAEWDALPDGRIHVEQRQFADANRDRIDADWEIGK